MKGAEKMINAEYVEPSLEIIEFAKIDVLFASGGESGGIILPDDDDL